MSGGWAPREHIRPRTPEFFANRARVRKRTTTCELSGCYSPLAAVDHIIPMAEGGSDALDNLQGLCQAHHDQKTAEEAARGRARRSGKRPPKRHPGRGYA